MIDLNEVARGFTLDISDEHASMDGLNNITSDEEQRCFFASI